VLYLAGGVLSLFFGGCWRFRKAGSGDRSFSDLHRIGVLAGSSQVRSLHPLLMYRTNL